MLEAILGGKCVDSGEDMGNPITNLVRSYLSVGGANRGTALCLDKPDEFVCNLGTGIHCASAFIRDINER